MDVGRLSGARSFRRNTYKARWRGGVVVGHANIAHRDEAVRGYSNRVAAGDKAPAALRTAKDQ
jgi:hypothetical protein